MSNLSASNAARWAKAKVKPEKRAIFKSVAQRLTAQAAKARYVAAEKRTGVPWFVIAVIHEREASQSWSANIAQGDPWNRVSRNVPAGRGPFSGWDAAADDALMNCAPYAGKWKDWSVGGTLELLERYNGLGYANRGVPSPYVWSGTDQYVSGKYVADHVYSATAVDQQLGCAGLILAMQEADASIKFGAPKPAPAVPAEHKTAGAIVTGGAIAAQQAHAHGFSPGKVVLVFLLSAAVAAGAWFVVRYIRKEKP